MEEAEDGRVESLRIEAGPVLLLVVFLVVVLLLWSLAVVFMLRPGLNHRLVRLAERWPPANP